MIQKVSTKEGSRKARIGKELIRRNVVQVTLLYIIISGLVSKLSSIAVKMLELPEVTNKIVNSTLFILFPISIALAWIFENSPEGLIKAGSDAAEQNPYLAHQKKPFTSSKVIIVLLVITVVVYLVFP